MPGINGEETSTRWTMRMRKEEKKMLYQRASSLGLSANKYVLKLILKDLEVSENLAVKIERESIEDCRV